MMNVFVRLAIFVCASFGVFAEDVQPRKKILVLCSNGGYGHNAAATTLKTLLGDKYEFKVVYPIDELRIWGVKSGEQIYNAMLQNGWIRTVNVISKYVAPKLFRTRKERIEEIIDTYIMHEKPALVISLIPFVNCPASEAARKQKIPYLIVTTDNDLQTWVHGLQGVSHPDFKVTVGNDLWCSREMLRKRNIPDDAIRTIGLPIRPDFFDRKDVAKLKADFKIPNHKPVVLVMIGGAGGDKALEYAETIGSINLGAHIIICAGKNRELVKLLEKVKIHPSNSITIMKFTDKISDLMAFADVIISKPGPGTLTEAMTMRLPILVDGTTPVLSWEQANIDLILHYGVGDCVRDLDEIENLLRKYLYDTELQAEIKRSYQKIPLNQFNQSISALIEELAL